MRSTHIYYLAYFSFSVICHSVALRPDAAFACSRADSNKINYILFIFYTNYRVSEKKPDTFVIQISREGIRVFLLTLYITYQDSRRAL